MKKLLCIVLALVLVLSFASCGKAVDETGEMNVYVLSGPTGIGALNLWEKAELGEETVIRKGKKNFHKVVLG